MPSFPVWKIATLATIPAFMDAKISYAVIRKTVAVLLQSSLVTAVILDLLFCMIIFSKLSVKIQCCKILNANLCWKREYQLQFGSCINFFCLFYAPCCVTKQVCFHKIGACLLGKLTLPQCLSSYFRDRGKFPMFFSVVSG